MRQRSRLLSALLGALLAAPLLVLGQTPASADPIPTTNYSPVALSDVPWAQYTLTDTSGGVTVGCGDGSATTAFKSFNASGTQTQDFTQGNPFPAGEFCLKSAVGKDGTVFLYAYLGSGNHAVQAWKNDSMVWQYTLPCGSSGAPSAMAMGANGNVYVAVTGGSGSCGSTQLFGLSPTAQTGTTTPQVVLNQSLSGTMEFQGLSAYGDGLVLHMGDAIQYVTYGGTAASPISLTNTLKTHTNGYRWFEAATGGRVFAVTKANPSSIVGCPNTNEAAVSVSAIVPSGTGWTANLGSDCNYVREVRPTPQGGAIVRIDEQPVAQGSYHPVPKLLAFNNAGDLLWTEQFAATSYELPVNNLWFAVDLNGNVAVRANAQVGTEINGSYYKFPEIRFVLLSGVTGDAIGGTQLALRGDSTTTSGPSYMYSGIDVSIAKNTAYVVAHQCTVHNNCNISTTKLYAFTVPGLEMDYPRGAILKYDEPWKNYVAIGDSYSSGEGVPQFITGTDTAGPPENRCHRSESAYSKLLGGNPAIRWQEPLFAACSGAETRHITGQWTQQDGKNTNELAQEDNLGAQVDVVTVSIGGNDIGFAKFVTRCLFLDCSTSAAKQPYFDAVNNLGTTLSNTYGVILTKASNAKVYVVSYPQVLPDPNNCADPLDAGVAALDAVVAQAHANDAAAINLVFLIGRSAGLTDPEIAAVINAGEVTFTSAEIQTGRDLATALNNKISATVTAKNDPDLKFVNAMAQGSPFAGHELCMSDTYFHGVDLANVPYSFHPNGKGQDAYRRLILSQL